MSAGPLCGVRVLDFCWVGAGALVTKALAELGASVYRIESRRHPDNLRLAPPYRPGTEGLEGSGYFASRNPSKRSIALDMSTQRGRELALRLAERVDAVTSNFRPGIMEKWGLGFEAIREANPRVIYLTMPMQGADGPHASYVGFGSTISALAGLVSLTGVAGRTPIGTGTHYPDHVPNPGHALVAFLAALRHVRRTGIGQAIELSQLESTVNIVGPAILEAGLGQTTELGGNQVPTAVPHGAFLCADGAWLVLACYSDDQWHALLGVLGMGSPIGAADSLTARKRAEEMLEDAVGDAVARFPRSELLNALDGAGVPNAPVNSSRDMVEEPALWRRGFWQNVDHPVIGRMPLSRSPFRRVGAPLPRLTPPPLLGQHTNDVLASELGLDEQALAKLAADGVLR